MSIEIKNAEANDMTQIFELYGIATAYMKDKGQVAWPEFEREMVAREIEEQRQWKLLIENRIAAVWATTQDDALIWREKNQEPAVYIHRIAVHPDFRGQKLVTRIVDWAKSYGRERGLSYIRLDTVGLNHGLIKHYTSCGFDFLGTTVLAHAEKLPAHYSEGDVCLFQQSI